MSNEAFEHHLTSPQGHRRFPEDATTVDIDGGACCDRLQFAITIDGGRVTDAGFEAHGCGAATAAGSAAVTLARSQTVLEAAKIGAPQIAAELGGLSPGKLHAAELAADALARALGAAVRDRGDVPAPATGTRTLVAMSGGVDSTVTAMLAARSTEAVAVTLELWADQENDAERSCCSSSAVAQARSLAHSMGLPHFTLDLKREFRLGVVDPFIAGYERGETPNPCVRCNGHVRLDAMLEFADRIGASTLATGHYARIAERDDSHGPLLRQAVDRAKDQTYMLAALRPESLARMWFPLGELTKPDVRRLAAQAGLRVAEKPDSQDLCFLAGTDRGRFLSRHGGVAGARGEIVDRNGSRLGHHPGQHLFTVGQRRGLGLAGSGVPLFVLDKQADTNRVIVGPRESLRTDCINVRGVRLHRDASRVDRVKLRYRAEPIPARTAAGARGTGDGDGDGGHSGGNGGRSSGNGGDRLTIRLGVPVEGAAPGQLACLLDGDVIVGWGTIDRPRSASGAV